MFTAFFSSYNVSSSIHSLFPFAENQTQKGKLITKSIFTKNIFVEWVTCVVKPLCSSTCMNKVQQAAL